MAKKKAQATAGDDSISSQIIKNFGNVITSGENFSLEKIQVIPISPSFDIALGDGIPEGSTVIMSGLEKCGKTTATLNFAANAQKPEFGGRNIYYNNIEARLKQRDLLGIKGLDRSKFKIIGSEPAERDDEGAITRSSKILNAAEFLSIDEMVLRDDPGCVVIIDSASSFSSQAEMEGTMSDQQRAETAKLLPKFFRRNASIISINKCIVIVICHLMENQSPKGKKYIPKGGMGLRYQADVNVQCTYFYPWKEVESDAKPIGQKSEWSVVTAALPGGIPGTKFTSSLRYGIGFDRTSELLDLGVEMGLIDKSGSWMSASFMENHLNLLDVESWDDKAEKICKAQGASKMYYLLEANPAWVDALEADIKAMLK